jgi:tRNA-dihydrouridine synthase
MEDVTDTVFRQVIQSVARPDVFFTEFTSTAGVQSSGQAKVIHRLKYSQNERPIVAQVWGITPDDYYKTAKLVVDLGFDGMDINMGCPVKNVIKQGACSALIKSPSLAKEIILATKEGLQNKIPLSVKTRIGFNKIETESWCGFLLNDCQPEVLTIHGRTVKEESGPPAHWDEIGKVVNINKQISSNKRQKLTDEEKLLAWKQQVIHKLCTIQ